MAIFRAGEVLPTSTVAVKKADLEKVQSFFSKVTAQKEKSP